MTDVGEMFREALESTLSEDSVSNVLARESLLASAEDNDELLRIADEVLAPNRAELDLHLDGATIRDHEAIADSFGRFVTRTATAVKEIAKAIGGLGRLGTRLQVIGPSPGSVRVIFRAPRAPAPPSNQTEIGEADTIEAVALRRLAAVLRQAESENEDSPLEASVHRLRHEARRAVRLLAQTVADSGWEIEGHLRQRGRETTEVSLTRAGAGRIIDAARLTDAVERTETVRGRVDGWIWSEATMLFEPVHGRRIAVGVDEDLQPLVADYVHERDQVFEATMLIVQTFPRGDQRAPRSSYHLTKIERGGVQTEIGQLDN